MALKTNIYRLLIATSLFAGVLLATAADRPNIVWIVSEDHSPLVSAYAEGQVSTPNLDRMAAEGIVLDNAFATSPICSPARFALIIGRHPSAHPSAESHRGWHDLEEPIVFFPQFMRDAGYYTANWGKTDYNTGRYLGGDTDLALEAAWDGTKFIWEPLGDDAPERGPHWRDRPDPDMPFFQQLNVVSTHMSQLFPQYRPEQPRHDPDEVILPPFHPDTPLVREDWAFFLDRLEEVDEQVGGVFEDLREDGELDDTIVFWFADHGGQLMRSKAYLFDSGTRVPMVIWFGKNVRHLMPEVRDGRMEELVAFPDMAPTVLNLLDMPIPEYMQGRPFLGNDLPAPRKYVLVHRARIATAIDLTRGVHDGRYLYLRNYHPRQPLQPTPFQQRVPSIGEWAKEMGKTNLPPQQRVGIEAKPHEWLFDTRFDPANIHDVKDNPAYQKVLGRMRNALDEEMEHTDDQGLYWNLPTGDLTFAEVNAAAKLAARGNPENIAQLREMLSSDEPILRFWGAQGAAELAAESAPLAENLRAVLDDPRLEIRAVAAEALALQGHHDEAIQPFREALQKTGRPEPSPALWALNAIQRIGFENYPELRPDLEVIVKNVKRGPDKNLARILLGD